MYAGWRDGTRTAGTVIEAAVDIVEGADDDDDLFTEETEDSTSACKD